MSKKTLAILIMVFSIGFGLIFAVGTSIFLLTEQLPQSWFGSTIFSILLIIFLSIISFRYGYKLYNTKPELPFDASEDLVTNLESFAEIRVNKNEFVKLSYLLNYRNPIIIWLTILGIAMLFNLQLFSPEYMESHDLPYLPIIIILYALVFTPISIYISANKIIKTNALLKETVSYHFTDAKIEVNGETFNSDMQWSMITSVREFKNWYILYIAKNRGYYIPKRAFRSAVDETYLRQLIGSKKNIKKKLKE